jgi:hypothetical protein
VALLDVITVDEAGEALRVRTAVHGQTLERLITAISRRFDDEFGAVVTRPITGETHKTRGLEGVLLDRWPVSAVTATLNEVAVTPVVDDDWGILFHPTETRWPVTRRPNLVVDYTAGRFVDTDSVTEEWREAAVVTLRHLWHSANPATQDAGDYEYVGPTFPRFVLPNAAVELLARYRRGMPAIG